MEEEIELTDFFSALWQKKKIIIITVVVFALVAFVGTTIFEKVNENKEEPKEEVQETPTTYYAQSTFLVATVNTTTTTYNEQITQSAPVDVTTIGRNYSDFYFVKTYSEIVKSQTVLNSVKEKLKLTDDITDSISVMRLSDSNLIAIIVADSDKEKAIKISDALTEEFVKIMSQTYIIDNVSVMDKAHLLSDKDIAKFYKDYIVTLTRSGKTLSSLLIDLEISKVIPKEHLRDIFETYVLTDEGIEKLNLTASINDIVGIAAEKPSKVIKYTVFSAALGLIASCGIILAFEIFRPTVNTNHNMDNLLALVEYDNEKSIFDILRIKLEKNRVMLITNAKESNKYSYISDNLAIAFANMDKKTLLIDLTSNESNLLENVNKKGLFDFIKDKSQKIDNYISKVNNLDLLLAGTEPASCLDDEMLEDILTALEKNYDYIIINTDNILENSNSLQLAKSVKNTILVATQRKTTLNDFNQAKELVTEIGGNVLGTVLLKK